MYPTANSEAQQFKARRPTCLILYADLKSLLVTFKQWRHSRQENRSTLMMFAADCKPKEQLNQRSSGGREVIGSPERADAEAS